MRMIWCFLLLFATSGNASERAAKPADDAGQAMAELSEEAYRLADGQSAEITAAVNEGRAWNLEKFAPVIAVFERAVALSASRRTAESPLPANNIMLELADIHEKGEDWPRAEQWRRRQLAELERLGFAEHETAAVVIALAVLRDRQGDTKGGNALAARAAKLIGGQPEPEPHVVVHTLIQLANRDLDRASRASAEGYATRAYTLAQAQDDLPKGNLLQLFELTQRLTRSLDDPLGSAAALPLLERELVLVQRLGLSEESIAFARRSVITSLILQDRRDAAVPYLAQQVDAAERQQRTLSHDYANAVYLLASISIERGDLVAALPHWQRLTDLNASVFGPRHGQTAAALEDLALLQQLAGQNDAAAQTRRRRAALSIDAGAKPLVDDEAVQTILTISLRPYLRHIEHERSNGALLREVDELTRRLERANREK